MTATERIKKMLNGEKIDSVGAAGWFHTPKVDRKSAEEFGSKIIELTDHSRWDFIKIMCNGVYMQEAYGSDIKYLTENIPPELLKSKMIMKFNSYLVNNPEDMLNFPVIDVKNNEVFKRETQLVEYLANHYKGTVPIIPTIFLPAHTIPEFCGGIEKARWYFENFPVNVTHMLESLLKTELQLVDAFIEAGADGFFFASRYSNLNMISQNEFECFCLPYEQKIMEHIKNRTWFNMIHIHGAKDFYFDYYDKYDIQAFSWENIPANVSQEERATVEKVREITDKILITGTDQVNDFYGTPEEVYNRFRVRVAQAAKESKDNRLIFAPGCSLPLDIEYENVHMLRVAADDYNKSISV